MSDLSNYGENSILNGTAMPATLYVKLHTGAPGEDGTANAAEEWWFVVLGSRLP